MAVVEIDPKLIVRDSSVRGAIPILPMPLATFCFVLNLLVPGLGTVMSGLFVCCCCCGRTRYTEDCNGDSRFCAFVMNCIIGLSQFATIILCLVGWCWSVGWGITLISVAKRNQVYLNRHQLPSGGTPVSVGSSVSSLLSRRRNQSNHVVPAEDSASIQSVENNNT